MLMLEFRANHSCIWGYYLYSHISLTAHNLLVALSNQLKQNDYLCPPPPPPPPPPTWLQLFVFWWNLGAPGEIGTGLTSSFPSLQWVCDVSRASLCSGTRSRTCTLVPAAAAAQMQSVWLISQSLRNKETGNINQPAWQLVLRSTLLYNKHHFN